AGPGRGRGRRAARDRLVERALLDVGQQQVRPVPRGRVVRVIERGRGPAGGGRILDTLLDAPRRQAAVRVVIVVHGQAELLEVVVAAHPPGRLAHLLHGRE